MFPSCSNSKQTKKGKAQTVEGKPTNGRVLKLTTATRSKAIPQFEKELPKKPETSTKTTYQPDS